MAGLSKDAILGAQDRDREAVDVPEWGGTVWVQALSGDERDAFEASFMAQKNGKITPQLPQQIRARLAALCLVDEQGQRLFSDGDIKALGAKSARALDRVFAVAQRLSGIGEQDIEELAKNSAAVPSDASPSA